MTNKEKYNRDTERNSLLMLITPFSLVFIGTSVIGFIKTNNDPFSILMIALLGACIITLYCGLGVMMYAIDRTLKNPYRFDDK